MKLATYTLNGVQKAGAVVDDQVDDQVDEQVYDLAACIDALGKSDASVASSTLQLLKAGPAGLAAAQEAVTWAQSSGGAELSHALSDVTLNAPLPCPGKMLCLAGNYADHIQEGGGTFIGKEKMITRFFSKPCTSITSTNAPVRIPPSVAWADWELEIAVVIGKEGRDISAEEADDYIVGYTIFNDISGRQLSFRESLPQQEGDFFFDWLVGKWLDTFGPMGPWITTADEIEHPDRLAMKLWHNGTLQQDASTGQMIFSPAEAIAFISQFVTLEPGDVISTGTPAGVGLAKKIKLMPGDTIKGEIEGLGTLENSLEAW